MSAQDLADACEEIGYSVPRNVIANMESGRRTTLPLTDIMVLAEALDTNPICLLYPVGYAEKAPLLPDRDPVDPWTALSWFTGEQGTGDDETLRLYRLHRSVVDSAERATAKALHHRRQAADTNDPGERAEALRLPVTTSNGPPTTAHTSAASAPPCARTPSCHRRLPPTSRSSTTARPEPPGGRGEMKGSTYRRCYCREPRTGKPLGKSCPKLATRKPGTYSVRQELPQHPDGSRRAFNRAGYPTLKEAQADLDRIRALLGVPGTDDTDGTALIADMLEQLADEKAPLPDVEETRRCLNTGQELTGRLTVGEWLDTWLAGKKGRPSAISRDESTIRLYFKPGIGHLRLDRLWVSHLTGMFEAPRTTWRLPRPTPPAVRRSRTSPRSPGRAGRNVPAARPCTPPLSRCRPSGGSSDPPRASASAPRSGPP